MYLYKRQNESINVQFGFTEGLSPYMASLVLSEVCSENTGKNTLLFLRPLVVETVWCGQSSNTTGQNIFSWYGYSILGHNPRPIWWYNIYSDMTGRS